MLNPPPGLDDGVLVAALDRGWGLAAASMAYRPVGFGSHHWEVVDSAGGRWFLTVDELETKRHRRDEPLDVAFDRLRSGLAAARGLCDQGHTFAVAPVPTRAAEPLARVADRFGVALYPWIDGESFEWGDARPEFAGAMLDLLIAVHTAPNPAGRVDDFTVPHRDELEATLGGGPIDPCGPYAGPAARLVTEHAAPIRRLLDRYDGLVREGRRRPRVLTHGEPHPGNTMRTPDGWLLIDWDTALIAPPERDLWMLEPADRSILDTYAAATGVHAVPAMLELYRVRWDLADLAVDLSRFRRPHTGDRNDDACWKVLRSLVARLSS